MKQRDITGMKSGHVRALRFNSRTSNGGCKWDVICEPCETEFVVWAEQITMGRIQQCKECRKKVQSEQRTTHGHAGKTKTKTYRAWSAMINRCTNPNNTSYSNYGGRGIKVCERWSDSFESFLADMGECPKNMSIERKDNSTGYSPENCVWATNQEQANNRRTNKTLTFNGKTQNWSQWSEELGIDKTTIRKRVLKGWPVEKILSTEKFFAGAANFKSST